MGGGLRFCNGLILLLLELRELIVLMVFILLMEPCSGSSVLPVGSGRAVVASTNDTWTSPNATFRAGFLQLQPASFYFCIWYNPDSFPALALTVVWVANRQTPVAADATLNFFPNGSVALLHANNSSFSSVATWSIPTATATSAQLLDSGNLVFTSNDSAGANTDTVLWQSFDHPIHTLLPGQSLKLQGAQLQSWSSTDSDPSVGLFSAFIEAASSVDTTSGKFRIVLSELMFEYYSFLTNGTYFRFTSMGLSSDGASIAFTDNGTDTTANFNPAVSISACDQNSSTTPYRRLTLDSDGNLRMYSWTVELLQWVVVWRALFDQCYVYNACGHNGVCTHNTTLNGANCPLPQPTLDQYCSCPTGYQAVDELNLFKGCKVVIPTAESTPDLCSASHMEAAMNYTFDLNLATSVIVASQDACQTLCTKDCSCLAVSYNPDDRNCSLGGSVLNGTAVSSVDPSKMLFMKVSGSLDSSKTFPVWGIVVIVVVAIVAMTTLAVMALYTRPYNPYLGVIGVQRFSYQHLMKITGNFRCLIGKGGFGKVYEGLLLDSNRKSPVRVAVKMLFRDEAHNSEQDFITEIETLGSVHHGSVVKLIGLCAENTKSTLLNCYKEVRIHRLLVYEFMEKGSLASCLFRLDNLLDWATRVQIMIEAADGLEYLHRFCRNRILHLDIKPDNILLDANYHAKVSDFGLAKVMEGGKTHTLNQGYIVGTHIYMAPECCMFGLAITAKADVYSFGVVILEIVSGKKATYGLESRVEGVRNLSLVDAITWMDSQDYLRFLDERLGEDFIEEELERVVKVALWCLQKEAEQRPTMEEVVAMINGTKDVGSPPLHTLFHLLNTQPIMNQESPTNTTDEGHMKQLQSFSASMSYQNVSGR